MLTPCTKIKESEEKIWIMYSSVVYDHQMHIVHLFTSVQVSYLPVWTV